MTFLTLFIMGIMGTDLEPKILDPVPGSYLTGKMTLQLACSDSEQVLRFQILGNDDVLYEHDGWEPEIQVDFGERIRSWRLILRVWNLEGQQFQSGAVLSKALRVDYEQTTRLILVPVVVKDRKGRNVRNLKQEHFKVSQDGRNCNIRLLESQKVPLRITLLVDTSSSLRREVGILKKSVIQFVNQLDPVDSSALITFSNQPQMVFDFGAEKEEIESRVHAIEPRGSTALFDGLLLAIEKLKKLPPSRKTIVLFTDGRDSIYEEVSDKRRMLKQIIEEAQNNEIAVFAIGLGENIHSEALEFIADETGGRFLHAQYSNDLQQRFTDVLNDLKNQYVLHVEPTNESVGHHRLEVKVNKRGTRVHARRGFVIE